MLLNYGVYLPHRKEWEAGITMSRQDTIRIRAPKDIMKELRTKFPNMNDANLIRVTYNSSLVKIEAQLRTPELIEKKREQQRQKFKYEL